MENKPQPLKRTSDYKEIASQGKRLKLTSWLQLQVLTSNDACSYCGITVSRKVGPAVIRNRLKRWVRNSVRAEKWPVQFESKKVVFVFRPQTSKDFYKQLKFKQFIEVYKRL